MASLNISYDGGQTSTSNFSFVSLPDIDRFYNSTPSGSVLLIILAFFALVFSVPALVWHVKNRSLPASSMVFWIVIENIYNIVNVIIWPNDNVDSWWKGEGYCDIEVKVDVASWIGLLGSLCCILRSLAKALDTDNARLMQSPAQRKRQLALEIFYCIALPIIFALLSFIVQPYRYYVLAIAGCSPALSDSWLTIMIFYTWSLVLSANSAYYSILLIFRIRRYRRDFSSILTSSTSGLNKSRFIRLFAAAMIMLIIVVPTQVYALYRNLQDPITTFSWNDTHNPATFQTIIFVPTYGVVFEDRWIRAGLGFPVFICFGWGRDAKTLYKSWAYLLGLGRFFPSLRPDDNTFPSGGGRKKLHLGTNTTNTSSVSGSTSSSMLLLSKAFTVITRPFSYISNLATSHGKSQLSSNLTDSSAGSNAKASPTVPSVHAKNNTSVQARDFALHPIRTSSLKPIAKEFPEDDYGSNGSEGVSIPLATLAARAHRTSLKKLGEKERKNRPHSLYSLGSFSASEATYVPSPSYSTADGNLSPSKAAATLSYGISGMPPYSPQGAHMATRMGIGLAISDYGNGIGFGCGSSSSDGYKMASAEGEGCDGEEKGKGTKRYQMEKQAKSNSNGKGYGKGAKRSWETAAEAMERVEKEREYERMVVGHLV